MYKRNFLIENNSIRKLINLIGNRIDKVDICKAGLYEKKNNCHYNMGFLVHLKTYAEDIYVFSKYINKTEFPILEVTNNANEHLDNLLNFEESMGLKWSVSKIENISIIRDHIEWTHLELGNHHYFVIDVGIKFILSNSHEFMIMLRDSSVGVIEFWYGKSLSWLNQEDQILSNYMFSEEEIISKKREEIPVYSLI